MTPTPAGRFNKRILDERMGQKDGGAGGAIKEEERNNMRVPWDGNKKKGITKAMSRIGFLVERLIKSLMA